jgi:hypothetical protein
MSAKRERLHNTAKRPRQAAGQVKTTPAAAPPSLQQLPANFRYQHDAFKTMLNAGTDESNKRFTVATVVHDWWNTIMGKPFPEEGGYAYDLILAMQYQTIKNSYDQYGIAAPKKFIDNYHAAVTFEHSRFDPKMLNIVKAEMHGKLAKLFIEPLNKGEDMATRRVSKTKTPAAAKAKPAAKGRSKAKPTVKAKPAAKGRSKAKPAAVAEEQRKPPVSRFVMALVVEQELTDKEIYEAATAEYPERSITTNVAATYRKEINAGRKEGVGFPAPKKPYSEIILEEEPAAAKAKPRSRKKTAPTTAGAGTAPAKSAGTGRVRRRARK